MQNINPCIIEKKKYFENFNILCYGLFTDCLQYYLEVIDLERRSFEKDFVLFVDFSRVDLSTADLLLDLSKAERFPDRSKASRYNDRFDLK